MMLRIVKTALLLVSLGALPAFSRELHVAKTGNDANPGTRAEPFLTIGRAAAEAQPGDVVTVHDGTYREWVKPPRGGIGENHRITYQAALGEEVLVKGSERITTWEEDGNGLWKASLPNSFFEGYNPFATNVSGGWLLYGEWHHLGDVYLDGEAYLEQQSLAEVRAGSGRWYCEANDETTAIWASFGEANPNEHLTEINVRESVFMPTESGLDYITVDGFHFMHSAENWQPPNLDLQMGCVGTRMGKGWVIQNCRVTNARCVGIILGHAPDTDYDDIDSFGDHIVRNNFIRRCGEAGIAGQKGACRSLIEGNLIEETNYRNEFGGHETAGIKFHNTVDAVIAGNLIRGVYRVKYSAYGVWIDFGNQGIRITRNIFCDTDEHGVFLEMNHGPILVDNNVFVGKGVRSSSQSTVVAHNLFIDSEQDYRDDKDRRSDFYRPHTRIVAGRKHGTPEDDRWFNNIFIRQGLADIEAFKGLEIDYNVYLQRAEKSPFADAHSLVDPMPADCRVEHHASGVRIDFAVSAGTLDLECPWVNAALAGVSQTVSQTIEDRAGNPIQVDTDLNGRRFSRPLPGPLADLKPGLNTIEWNVKKHVAE